MTSVFIEILNCDNGVETYICQHLVSSNSTDLRLPVDQEINSRSQPLVILLVLDLRLCLLRLLTCVKISTLLTRAGFNDATMAWTPRS